MIGIQGENGLEEVTKSPCDTSLDANSTNAVENRVVTQEINEIKSELSNNIIYFKDYNLTVNVNASGIQRINTPVNLGTISNVLGVEIISNVDSDWINPILTTCTTSSFKYLIQNLNPNTAKSGTITARLFYQK